MTLNKSLLKQKLSPRDIRFYESVDSTNDIALDWLREGALSGAVVIADEQRRGRGRMGRIWYTPPGVALAVSVVLKPPPNAVGQITMLGAVAVAQMCESLGIAGVGIKWPNDVQINGRKVCGILPEAAWDGDRLTGVVLGIGVNVRVDFQDDVLRQMATNIETEYGQSINRTDLLVKLLSQIDCWSASLGTADLLEAWRKRLVTLGLVVVVREVQGDSVEGLAETVDEQGALCVRLADGTLKRFLAGDVTLR